jgi:hypothetical protein
MNLKKGVQFDIKQRILKIEGEVNISCERDVEDKQSALNRSNSPRKLLLKTKTIKRAENYDNLMNKTNSNLPPGNKKFVLKRPFPLLTFLSNKFILNNSKNLLGSLMDDHTDYLRVLNLKSKIEREKSQPLKVIKSIKRYNREKDSTMASNQSSYFIEKPNTSSLKLDTIEGLFRVSNLNRRSSMNSNSNYLNTNTSTNIDIPCPCLTIERQTPLKTEVNAVVISSVKNQNLLFKKKSPSQNFSNKIDRYKESQPQGFFITTGKAPQLTYNYESGNEIDNYFASNPKNVQNTFLKSAYPRDGERKMKRSMPNFPIKIEENEIKRSKMRILSHKFKTLVL